MPRTQHEHYIDLIRHGEPEGGDLLRGTKDDPLSEKGWQQMRAAVADSPPWNAIVSSPLRRCAEFAIELAEQHGLPLEFESDLREIAFGDWEGRTYCELTDSAPHALKSFFQDPLNNTPPNGEPLSDFAMRTHAVWDAIAARHSGSHILIVSHGAVMRTLFCRVMRMPLESLFSIEVPYACRSRIRRHPEGDRLVYHNAGANA